ncbi:MAG: diguanylate cyclase [Acidobacteria bacterium]|nr:diguanylate cyclase [Acidobacteriota bacterium]MBV9435672.1 diguanylate cyclase [Acidobacteriota bacterium]
MADFTKRIEKAEKYLQKGKVESALEEYLSILDDDPGNDSVRQSAADLFLQVNRTNEAAALFSELFDRQIAAADNTRAIVTYKKLARVVPPALGQTLRFAQVSERNGNRREALEAYEAALAGFQREGRKNEALSALRKIAALDPNETNLKRMAELAASLKDHQSAGEAYLKLGLAEEEQGHIGFAWFERAHQQDPANPDIAFRFGKGLLDKGEVERAVKVLKPAGTAEKALPDYREAYGMALIAAHRGAEAYKVLAPLYEHAPAKLEEMALLLGELLHGQHHQQALELARKLEAQQQRLGRRKEFITFLRDVSHAHPPDAPFLEYLIALFNSANREHDYCDALIRLFELRFASGDFIRAADALDRAAEVDPYLQGLAKKLEMLRGKIDGNRYRAIGNRLHSAETESRDYEEPKQEEPSLEGDTEPTVLEDLLLQAEIFLQYSMRSKAVERLERIQKLFPGEDQRNENLRQLLLNAGMVAQPSAETPAPAAPPSAPAATPKAAPPAADEAVDNFARVTEITRNIYRQPNVKSVLFAAVNDVGRHWKASRCIAGLCSPGKPPSAALEYCAPGVKQSDVMSIVRLIAVSQQLALKRGSVAIENVATVPELAALQALDLKSVLASPLCDGDEHVGILILEQIDKPRPWRPTDVVVLKTIADQMVLAVNNAKLRSLVKTLAVTDEKSGLLKRASYIDVMMAEVKRSLQQNAPMTVMLLNFGRASLLIREGGEAGLEEMMQNVGQSVCATIRQTDTAVRYDRTSIALILGDTKDTNAFFVVDKLRKLLASVKTPGTENPVTMTVGIAGAAIQKEYEPVDIVTEVINRAEQALEVALGQGPNCAHALAPITDATAVA